MTAAIARAEPIDYPAETRGLNFFDLDVNLRRLLWRRAPGLLERHEARLGDFGAWVGGPLDAQAAYSDRIAPPHLESHDRQGNRSGRVICNPAYLECHREAYRRGVIGLCYGAEAAPHLLSFVMGYLLSSADISIHCPVTMTGALAYVLDRFAPEPLRAAYLPELVRRDGAAKSGGTWATEAHGGSDLGATTTVARPDGAAWRLTGLKWFASNADCGLALVTARPQGAPEGGAGLGCYLLPDRLPDGAPNRYWVRRLKDKLGTRGLPTGEIDLEDAWALEIAGPGEGLKVMMAALGYSRIHNAVAACGVQRRALLEALCWASHREAFGAPIRGYPMVRDALLDLATETEASTALAFEAGIAFDAALAPGGAPGDANETARAWLRTATALAKYRTAERGVRAAIRAIEIVGGNGYTEEWPTARLFRDAMVLPVWEGPVNIQALELLRAATGKLRGDAAFVARVAGVLEAAPAALDGAVVPLRAALEDCRAALAYLRGRPEEGPRQARRLLDLMADTLAGALLVEEAAFDLKAGDGRKACIARRFIRMTFGPRAAIGPEPDPDHAEVERLLGYAVIDFT